jgi:hypothetical protein
MSNSFIGNVKFEKGTGDTKMCFVFKKKKKKKVPRVYYKFQFTMTVNSPSMTLLTKGSPKARGRD